MFDHKNIWPRLAGLSTTNTSTRTDRHKPRQHLHAERKAEASEYKRQLAEKSQKSMSLFISAPNQILEAVMGISMTPAHLRVAEQDGRTKFIV